MSQKVRCSSSEHKGIMVPIIIVLALALCLSGCLDMGGPGDDGGEGKTDKKTKDSDGDGLPDSEDPHVDTPEWGVNLTFLDDTMKSPKAWSMDVCSPIDYGVLLVRNLGFDQDEFKIDVLDDGGWKVNLEKDRITLNNGSVAALTFTVRPSGGAAGESPSVVFAALSMGNPDFKDNITIEMTLSGTGTTVAAKGDQTVVTYVLHDTSGDQLDAGTLPATAGEPEAGPAGQLSYIEGFYMGILGMYRGENKKIRVPPELAYGTDPDAHELGGETLIFTLDLDMLISL